MASSIDSEDDVFETLRSKVDPKVESEREKAFNERLKAQNVKAQSWLSELVGRNATQPVTINTIRVIGASNTRRGFLDRLFSPILAVNRDRPYELQEALGAIGSAADKLRKFDIYEDNLTMFVDRAQKTDPATTVSDLDIFLKVKERSRLKLQTGTDIGNAEGSGYFNVLLRNVFGGAESFNANASFGTRTRSSYAAILTSPILSNPNLIASVSGISSTTQKPWASHEELLKGGSVKVQWGTSTKGEHEFGYSGTWRQLTGLAGDASPTVRMDAGDSFKSSITHTWLNEKRDYPLLPSCGHFMKTVSEIAGWGPLSGDVAFWKSEAEVGGALPIPLPGVDGPTGISITGGVRSGMIYPLPLGFGSLSQPSRVNDRFQLGGPTDVRGFKISGLGPRDGADSVGGDIYVAASANLLVPFPRVGKDSPLRFQLFANGGRLLALKSRGDDGGMDSKAVQKAVYGTVAELAEGLPSIAAGFGVVYAHPQARFELNFSLPLSMRRGEESRKGLQFGVGINFL